MQAVVVCVTADCLLARDTNPAHSCPQHPSGTPRYRGAFIALTLYPLAPQHPTPCFESSWILYVQVYPHGSTDALPFATMGSGSLNAMAVFENGYKDDMDVEEAKALVTAAIRAGECMTGEESCPHLKCPTVACLTECIYFSNVSSQHTSARRAISTV